MKEIRRIELDLENPATTPVESVPGTMMPIGSDYAVGFYEYPKLFELRTGRITQTWPELNTGRQNSSIIHNQSIPPLAMDNKRSRFAVADQKHITIIELG